MAMIVRSGIALAILASTSCGGSSLSSVAPEAGMAGAGGTGVGGAAGRGGAPGIGGAPGLGGNTGSGGRASDASSGSGGASQAKDASSDSPDANSCQLVQCFRAVNCVATCGGPIVQSGCCPCVAPAFDSIQCRDGSPSMQ